MRSMTMNWRNCENACNEHHCLCHHLHHQYHPMILTLILIQIMLSLAAHTPTTKIIKRSKLKSPSKIHIKKKTKQKMIFANAVPLQINTTTIFTFIHTNCAFVSDVSVWCQIHWNWQSNSICSILFFIFYFRFHFDSCWKHNQLRQFDVKFLHSFYFKCCWENEIARKSQLRTYTDRHTSVTVCVLHVRWQK